MSKDRLSHLREYRDLEARASKPGLTPLEFLRLLELRRELGPAVADEAGEPLCMIAEFDSYEALADSWVSALAGGGVFVATPFAPPVSTELVLAVLIKESGERFEVPGVVPRTIWPLISARARSEWACASAHAPINSRRISPRCAARPTSGTPEREFLPPLAPRLR